MHTQTTNTFQHVTDTTLSRSRWNWNRIRTIAFWATTFIIVFELVAGSVWNLKPIEWNVVQLRHLGYPTYLAFILGVWHVGAAVAIAAPGLPVLKEWAYAGSFFLWSGAVTSHLLTGDGPESWSVPLVFATCAIASWALRPADRRLRADRPETSRRAWETPPRAWAVSIGIVLLLYAVSFLTLPWIEAAMHERAVELGWIAR
jgi:DoxX-like family